jgi:predicted RecB family nuclease
MTITPHLFAAHLKCTTKCWLRAVGENSTGNAYAEWVQDQNESYRAAGLKRLLSAVSQHECVIAPAAGEVKTAKWRLAVDVPVRTEEFPSSEPRSSRPLAEKPKIRNPQPEIEISLATSAATTNEDEPKSKWTAEARLHAVERVPSEGRSKPAQFIPVRFVFTNKLGKDNKLLLAFDALALSKALGREVSLGKIIHGDEHSTLTVKTSALAGEVRKRLEKIAALLSSPAPPDLVLNRHCAECEFQTRCRQKALEKDDLSLLSGMSAKERQKLRSKGIFTVTQLSYTFRPRRRPKRQRDKREKYHHSLKALAIREKKIHIVGSPELKIEGTPVYLDIEGLPDRDFYYLIGVRIGNSESAVQHSLWADTVEDEGKIWREFLGILETVEKPVLIHYGGFESTFMRHMRQQYGEPPQDSLGHRVIKSSINLVSVIFAQFYFPTHSNGLKDVAKILGFQWSDPMASGTRSVVVCSGWEQSHEPTAKDWLVRYNANDCEALEIVASTLLRTCGHPRVNESNLSDMVNVESLKPQMSFSFGKKESVTPDLEFLRKAAYWDYQRDRLYFRPSGKRRPKSRNVLAGCTTTSMRIKRSSFTRSRRNAPPASGFPPSQKRRVRGFSMTFTLGISASRDGL